MIIFLDNNFYGAQRQKIEIVLIKEAVEALKKPLEQVSTKNFCVHTITTPELILGCKQSAIQFLQAIKNYSVCQTGDTKQLITTTQRRYYLNAA